MMIKKKVRRYVRQIEDVICNKCGKSCKVILDDKTFTYEHANIYTTWGYGSERDGEAHDAHLCEQCFYKVVKGFKHPTLLTK